MKTEAPLTIAGMLFVFAFTLAPAEAAGQCNECISQKLGGIWEHWFGNTPDDLEWDGSHTSPLRGTCDDWHESCGFHEEDVEEALAAVEAGAFGLDELRELRIALGGKLLLDAEVGRAYAMSCEGTILAEFVVPQDWIATVLAYPLGGGSRTFLAPSYSRLDFQR